MENITINFNEESSKRILFNKLKTLSGAHQIIIKKVRTYTTRYKYIFDHIYQEIAKSGHYTDSDGHPLSKDEIHDIMKIIYNPKTVVDRQTGEIRIIAGDTKTISDKDFIEQFEERIIIDHSQEPYNIDFMDRGEWIDKWKSYYNESKRRVGVLDSDSE